MVGMADGDGWMGGGFPLRVRRGNFQRKYTVIYKKYQQGFT